LLLHEREVRQQDFAGVQPRLERLVRGVALDQSLDRVPTGHGPPLGPRQVEVELLRDEARRRVLLTVVYQRARHLRFADVAGPQRYKTLLRRSPAFAGGTPQVDVVRYSRPSLHLVRWPCTSSDSRPRQRRRRGWPRESR